MPFELQPTLRGALVELRALQADDYDALYAVASDPLIWEQHPESTRYQPDVFRRFFQGAMESGAALLATDAQTGQVIGSSRYHDYNEELSEIEIGWTFLARSHWGGRYNGEMKRLMLEHAFKFVTTVIFLIDPQNIRSQKAVERIGGIRSGSRLNADGRESFVFRITEESFKLPRSAAFPSAPPRATKARPR